MGAWVRVARIEKTKSLKGSLVVQVADGASSCLRPGLSVSFVPPTADAPRSARVRDVRPLGADGLLVDFEGIDSIDAASALVGKSVLVERGDATTSTPVGPTSWTGYAVIDDTEGALGCVVEALTDRPQALLRVRDSAEHEVLIPVVDDLIRQVDADERRILVDLPAGLVDLNESMGD